MSATATTLVETIAAAKPRRHRDEADDLVIQMFAQENADLRELLASHRDLLSVALDELRRRELEQTRLRERYYALLGEYRQLRQRGRGAA
jgi:hypothetical protein